jgi:hypothetical protein
VADVCLMRLRCALGSYKVSKVTRGGLKVSLKCLRYARVD